MNGPMNVKVEGRFEVKKDVFCLDICGITICKGFCFPACVVIDIYNNNLVVRQRVFVDAFYLQGTVSDKSRRKYLDFPIYSSLHQ
jgi:hypothetical protein